MIAVGAMVKKRANSSKATGRTRDQPAIGSRRDGGLRGTTLRRGAGNSRALRVKTMSNSMAYRGSHLGMRLLFTSMSRAHGGRHRRAPLIVPDGGWFDPPGRMTSATYSRHARIIVQPSNPRRAQDNLEESAAQDEDRDLWRGNATAVGRAMF